jgi:hypothetical protein
MASKIQICNLALTRLSASRIISLDDNTVESNDCNAIYDLIAEEVMSFGSWMSVRRRAELALSSDTPTYEYTYSFQLPTNPKCLRVISINESKPGDVDFTIEGDKLLINDSTVAIRYLAYITNTESYDIYLRQAIVDRLVAELIYSKTGQLTAYKAALEYYQTHARDLLAQSAIAGSAENINSDTFIDARLGSFPDDSRMRDL